MSLPSSKQTIKFPFSKQQEKLGEKELLRQVFSKRLDAYSATVLSDFFTIPFSDLHYYLFQLFPKKIHTGAREVIAAPRGFGKSTVISLAWVLWLVCESARLGKNIYDYIILLSDVFSQASDFLSDIKRELESNQFIKYFYPEVYGKGTRWRDEFIVTKNGIMIRAMGSLGNVRGRKYKQHRVGLVIGDDIESRKAIFSETYRDHLGDWFSKDVLKTGGPKKPADIFVVGTILHPLALLNKLLTSPEFSSFHGEIFKAVLGFAKNQDLWDEWKAIYQNRFDPKRKFHAWIYYKKNEIQMLDGVKLMWNEGPSYYSLMEEMIGEGTASFYSEKQNEPFDPSDIIFPESIFTFYSESDIDQLLKSSEVYIYLDPTVNKTKKSDYYALIVLMRHIKSGYLFVLVADVERKPPSYQKDELIRYSLKYLKHVKYVGIESNGFQALITKEFRKQMRELGIYVSIIPVTNVLSKRARISKLEPLIKSGTIQFNKKHLTLYQQLHLYGIIGNDDGPDGLAGAVELINRKRFKLLTYGG